MDGIVQPSNAAVVLLGASKFPLSPGLSNPALRGAADALREYFTGDEGMGIPSERVLDLFDSAKSVTEQCNGIRDFVERVRAPATILVYVGHGAYTRDRRQYCLIVSSTRQGLESSTALRLDALVEALGPALTKPLFGVLDCCFAGEAVKDFQGSHDEPAMKELAERMPSRGTALLLASSKDDVAMAPAGEGCTRFTTALVKALEDASGNDRLSMREIALRVQRIMRQRWPDDHAAPQIHSPRQEGSDLANDPFFPIRRAKREWKRPPRIEPVVPKHIGPAHEGWIGPVVVGAIGTWASLRFAASAAPVVAPIASGLAASALACFAWGFVRLFGIRRRLPGGIAAEALIAFVAGIALWTVVQTGLQ